MNQRRILAQHFLEDHGISSDHRVCRTFELGECGVCLREFANVLRKLRPALKRVFACEHQLSISEARLRQLAAIWMKLADTLFCFRIFGLEGLQKILGLFLVLIEIGMER